ncbi:MAG TPA: DUF3107 family protein [Acidimicrobiia bacterium]|nr:DUF3107 family protein [Acidimicrobiia bacterium]
MNETLEEGYDEFTETPGAVMRVRIGIAETDKLVEIEIEDVPSFKAELERAVGAGELAWFTDSRGRTVGVPARQIAFVEIEDTEVGPAVGFAPAV